LRSNFQLRKSELSRAMGVAAPAKLGAPRRRTWQCKILKNRRFSIKGWRRKWRAGAFDRLRSKGVAEWALHLKVWRPGLALSRR